MIDQTSLMNQVTSDLAASVDGELAVANRLLGEGVDVEDIAATLPNVAVKDGRLSGEQRQAEIRELRRAHLNQYRWEGAFFLGVLLLGMVVLARAMSREVELRLRQENFLAAVTHELKSPLASLRLALQTMERRDLDEPQRRRLIGRNLVDLDRLEGLVSNVLESSRLDSDQVQGGRSGKEAGLEQTVALAQLADQVLGGMAKVEQLGCDVVNEIPRDLMVKADAHGVTTTLRNLLDNAVEATRASTEPRVALTAGETEQGTWLAVEDNGHGFEAMEADRLFDKFYRPGDELTRARAGTGLGLFLVRRFAELEGGAVRASSPGVGQGARFEVRWP